MSPDWNQQVITVDDTKANGDLIWWWPDTTLLDPGKFDTLRFFGLPLTGGNNVPTMTLGGTFGAARAVADGGAGLTLFHNAIDPKTGKWDPTHQIYFDHFMPFLKHYFQKQRDGTIDLYIFNQLTGLDGANLFTKTPDDPNTPQNESTSLAGAMRKFTPRLLSSRISSFLKGRYDRQTPICQKGIAGNARGVPVVWRGAGMRPQHACMEATCAANDDVCVGRRVVA